METIIGLRSQDEVPVAWKNSPKKLLRHPVFPKEFSLYLGSEIGIQEAAIKEVAIFRDENKNLFLKEFCIEF